MNQDQALSALRWLVTGIGGYAVGRGWITADQVTYILGALAALVPLVWSFLSHTDSAKIAAVTAMPEVKQVVVTPTAPDTAAAQAAASSAQPKVTTR